MDFKEILKMKRKEYRLKQSELAKIIDVSAQSISKYELGEAEPALNKLIVLADYFGLTLDELVGREPRDIPDFLDDDELQLIRDYKILSPPDRGKARKIIRALSDNDQEESEDHKPERFAEEGRGTA